MRKFLLPVLMSGTLLLGGCAYGLGGGLLGGILDNGRNGQNSGDDFERAAVDACGREASRFGRVSIGNVDRNRDTVRVTGRVDVRDNRGDEFTCTFRSDGRIVDFRRY